MKEKVDKVLGLQIKFPELSPHLNEKTLNQRTFDYETL